MLKHELVEEVGRLNGLVRTAGERLEASEQETLTQQEKVQAIKHIVLTRDREIARLNGYLERVREEDDRRNAPQTDFQAWQRDRDQRMYDGSGAGNFAEAFDDRNTKHWLDL